MTDKTTKPLTTNFICDNKEEWDEVKIGDKTTKNYISCGHGTDGGPFGYADSVHKYTREWVCTGKSYDEETKTYKIHAELLSHVTTHYEGAD